MRKVKKETVVLSALTVLCVLLALLCRPVRVLLLCLAGVLLCVLLLDFLAKRQKERWARRAVRIFALLLSGAAAALMILEGHIIGSAETDRTTSVSAVVILGAGVNGTEPSLSLRTRLEAALEYITDKPELPIIVTGGRGDGELISEAQCMKNWLCERGVAAERIRLEEQARNTRENIRYSTALLHEIGIDTTDNIAVVTSDYHLYRAGLYWGTPWMVPVAAVLPAKYAVLTVNYYLREAFAVAKLLVFGG